MGHTVRADGCSGAIDSIALTPACPPNWKMGWGREKRARLDARRRRSKIQAVDQQLATMAHQQILNYDHKRKRSVSRE